MPLSQLKRTPLTQENFERISRDDHWQLNEVYLDTFEASHDPLAAKVVGGGGHVHYVIKRTGRTDFPYLLFGPYVGSTSTSPWPSKKDVDTFFSAADAGRGVLRAESAQARMSAET